MNVTTKIRQATNDLIIPICLSVMALIMVLMWAEDVYWKYRDFRPLILHLQNDKISILNSGKTVCAGSPLVYGFDFEKTMDVKCTVKRQLVDGSLIMFDPVDPPRKSLGLQSIVADLFVPIYAANREWFMRWTSECEVGPNKRIIPTTAVSEKFRVIDCSKPAKGTQGPPGKPGAPGKPGKDFWGK